MHISSTDTKKKTQQLVGRESENHTYAPLENRSRQAEFETSKCTSQFLSFFPAGVSRATPLDKEEKLWSRLSHSTGKEMRTMRPSVKW